MRLLGGGFGGLRSSGCRFLWKRMPFLCLEGVFCTSSFNGKLHDCKADMLCNHSIASGDGSTTAGYYKDNIQLDKVIGNHQTNSSNGTRVFRKSSASAGSYAVIILQWIIPVTCAIREGGNTIRLDGVMVRLSSHILYRAVKNIVAIVKTITKEKGASIRHIVPTHTIIATTAHTSYFRALANTSHASRNPIPVGA
ncbi:unnamed protein product [Malus baccata var. baccata]